MAGSVAVSAADVAGLAWPRGGRDEEAWQAAILAEQLAALGVGEPPADGELWDLVPDHGADLVDDPGVRDRLPELFPPGVVRSYGDRPGRGFAHGGVLDSAEPGPVLAGFAADAWAGGLNTLDDDQLIGVVRAWRRLSSWAAAGELAAVGELVARRERDREPRPYGAPLEGVTDELACALVLTCRGADGLVDRAVAIRHLPKTAAALAQGLIDMPKALVIADGLAGLDRHLAQVVEARLVEDAPAKTTGELRAAVRRAVLAADPEAALARREQAQKDARVEVWDEAAGTKALAGRDLPPAGVLAADKRISAIASQLKKAGAEEGMDQLRARVYLALLAGQPLEDPLPGAGPEDNPAGVPAGDPVPRARAAHEPGEPSPRRPRREGSSAEGPGDGWPGLLGAVTAAVNLTVPLATLLGRDNAPGEAAGFGPIDAWTARAMAGGSAQHERTRWCVTVTDEHGTAIGHGCASPRARAGPEEREPEEREPEERAGPEEQRSTPAEQAGLGQHRNVVIKLSWLASKNCAHDGRSTAYEVPPRLRHLIEIRDRTCSFPGCRQPAIRCDKDHTVPYEKGGSTCACNISPLCRRHHQVKQAEGWSLRQPCPGVLEWITPAGRAYVVRPGSYP
ncbi:MAG: DUF222 domain-containing protein [Micromonosporaceae bacterium]